MKAGRKNTQIEVKPLIDPDLNQPQIEGALARHRADEGEAAMALAQRNEKVDAIAREINYQGSTDADVLENRAKDAIGRIGMAIFELGGYLLLMKEACEHGKFLPALERLGLGVDAAQRYMAITRRFSNTATSRHLATLGMSKLVELLPLDDEQVADLTGLGETGELALDKAATMSVRELRATVRELLAEKDATDKLLATKDAKINKLSRHIAKATPDDVLLELQKEATAHMNDAVGCLRGQIRQVFIAIKNHSEDDHSIFMAGLVGQMQSDLNWLRNELDLPDVSTAAEQQLANEVAQWGGSK